MRQTIIEMNWRSRQVRNPKVLKGHDDHVITCLQFCGNRIVSGSDDNTLKVWSAITGKVSCDLGFFGILVLSCIFRLVVSANAGWTHWWSLVIADGGQLHHLGQHRSYAESVEC